MWSKSRLVVLGVVVVTTMALAASPAHSELTVTGEAPSEPECGEVIPLGPHGVEGGCHVELEGDLAFYAHTPAETPLFHCHVDLEAFLGSNGTGFITRADIGPSPDPPPTGCSREACDEAGPSHQMLRWPVALVESGPGTESSLMVLCTRTGFSEEGTAGIECWADLGLTADPLTHENELGEENAHHFCDVTVPFPISIKLHLSNEAAGEEVAIVHDLNALDSGGAPCDAPPSVRGEAADSLRIVVHYFDVFAIGGCSIG